MGKEWFGPRLRELREAAGLTHQQLAERAGVSVDGVSQWERGVREPGWGSVLSLAQALGVDCTAFAQEPRAEAESRGPGRPRKPAPAGQPSGEDKRPRGRPKKAPEPAAGRGQGEEPSGEKPATKKRKGG